MHYRTIFLDTQIIIQVFEKNDQEKLSKILDFVRSENVVPTLTLESLVEISRSYSLERCLHLVESMVSLEPLWARAMVDLQALELNNFVAQYYLEKDIDQFPAFFENFGDLFSDQKLKIRPVDFVTHAYKSAENRALRQREEFHTSVLTELQNATKEKKFSREMNNKSLQNVIALRLQRPVLDRSDVHTINLQDLLKFCSRNNWDEMFSACPSLKMENLMSNFRSSDYSRKPKISDQMDLTMACATFPYVDYFVTDDGYLRECLKYVKLRSPQIKAELKNF